jgi:hypothetical protein
LCPLRVRILFSPAIVGTGLRVLLASSRPSSFALLLELPLVVLAYFGYFLVRGLTEGSRTEALANADAIVRLEQSWGIYWEPAWQELIIDHRWLVEFFNSIYIYGHWPVIVPAALWLFFAHRDAYVRYRNAFFLSGAIGMILFLTFPVAPPRLADLGLVDTVTLYSDAYRVLQPPAFVNQYAAFPSLHFGWNLLVGVALVCHARNPLARAFGVALPGLMMFAVVATANHFILDVVAGAALTMAALGVSCMVQPALLRTAARTSQP